MVRWISAGDKIDTFSATQGGEAACGRSGSARPAFWSSSPSRFSPAMRDNTKHEVFADGCLQTVPFHPLSCQGTRIEILDTGRRLDPAITIHLCRAGGSSKSVDYVVG